MTQEQDDDIVASATQNVSEDMQKRVLQYREIREAIERVKEKHEQELKPLRDIQEILSGRIRVFMETNKLENLRTKHGTATISTRYTATVADAEAFMNFVKDGNWDLIERRANSTAVRAYTEEHKHLPAGVNLSAVQTVGIRRPTAKNK